MYVKTEIILVRLHDNVEASTKVIVCRSYKYLLRTMKLCKRYDRSVADQQSHDDDQRQF